MNRIIFSFLSLVVLLSASCSKKNDEPVVSVVSFTPANNSTGVAINTTLSITFNENISLGSGVILVKYDSTNLIAATISVASDVTVNGKTATLSGVTLQYGTTYYVEIPNTAFKNLAGKAYAGFSGKTTWRFKTVAAPGSITPTTANLSGNYKINKITVTSTGSSTETDVTNSWLMPCEKDDVLTLNTNGTYILTDAGVVCSPPGTDNGVWSLINPTSLNIDGSVYTIERWNGVNLDISITDPSFGKIKEYLIRQ